MSLSVEVLLLLHKQKPILAHQILFFSYIMFNTFTPASLPRGKSSQSQVVTLPIERSPYPTVRQKVTAEPVQHKPAEAAEYVWLWLAERLSAQTSGPVRQSSSLAGTGTDMQQGATVGPNLSTPRFPGGSAPLIFLQLNLLVLIVTDCCS